MPETPIGGITHIDESQDDKEVTANEAWDYLEAQLQDFHTEDCAGSSNVTIATDDARLNQFFDLTGVLTGSIDVIVPTTAGGISYAKQYIVRNSTTGAFTITFKVSGGTGITIERGGWHLCRSDGTDMHLVGDFHYKVSQYHGDGQGTPFVTSQLLFQHVFETGVDTAVDMPSSQAVVNSSFTVQKDLILRKNGGGSIGTIRFGAGATVGVWGSPSSISAQSFVAGDILTIEGPVAADVNAADISITFVGNLA
jgi:hypothetical protein